MFNWIDVIVILVVAVYIVDGYRQGFLRQIFDLLGIIVSFLVAIKFYGVVGTLLSSWGLGAELTKPIGFFVLWAVVQMIFYLGGFFLFRVIPDYLHYSRVNKSVGLVAGLVKGVIVVSIFLILMMVLPIGSKAKEQISGTYVAGYLIKATAHAETQVSSALWQMNNNLGFMGIVPENGEDNDLGFKTNQFAIDETAENEMLKSLNDQRAQAGLAPLKSDILLRNIARAHSMDMVIKGYFSHIGSSGESPSDRLTMAGADFTLSGENLALAPSTELAMIGLMNSPKHRENILSKDFVKVGIGALDLGHYGKIYTQVYTD